MLWSSLAFAVAILIAPAPFNYLAIVIAFVTTCVNFSQLFYASED